MNSEPRQPDEQPSSLWDDPVVEEVRTIRRKLWEASGRDIQRFIEQTRQADQRRTLKKPGDKAN